MTGPLLVIFLGVLFPSLALGFFPTSRDRFLQDTSCYEVNALNKQHKEATSLGKFAGSSYTPQHYKDTAVSNSSNETFAKIQVKPGISILQSDEHSQAYFVDVTIGDVAYPLIIDTGSAYLWVYGDSCNSSSCKGRKLFSTTNVLQDVASFSLAYTSGVAVGDVYHDRIIVNQLATTDNFTFGVASEVPDIFENYPASGIFGLPSDNSQSIENIISKLRSSNAISMEKFSILIGHINAEVSEEEDGDVQDLTSNKGIFAIGDELEGLYKGEIYYNNLIPDKNSYWSLKINNLYVNDYKVNFTNYENFTGSKSHNTRSSIIDSGTTLLILPKQDALDIHTYFENSITDGTNFAIMCNSTQTLTLEFDNKNWTIPSEKYLGDKYSQDSAYYGYCVSNIQGLDIDDAWILGDVFLEGIYAVFDVENQRLGFAEGNENALLVPYSKETNATTSSTNNTSKPSSQSTAEATLTSTASASTTSSSSKSNAGLSFSPRSRSLMLTIVMLIFNTA